MPSRIDGPRAIPTGPCGSDSSTFSAGTSSAKPLNFDVLRGVFSYLQEPRDIVNVALVSHLWHEAAVSRPLVAPWYTASNRALQNFVRNKAQAVDLFRKQKPQAVGAFEQLVSQQTSLRLEDVDQGLNLSRMQQAFAGMPALRALSLSRTNRPHNRGAAVMCWGETANLHERVRRQSVPPEPWLGALPPQLTHLDLSRFSLRGTEENAGRPVLENHLIDGLMQSLQTHQALTHVTLGAFDVDKLVLPRSLTHLTLTRTLYAQQTHVGLASRLLREIPLGLTHLYASNKVSLAQLPANESWPEGLALEHLSIHIKHDELARLQHILRPPLRSLELTCGQSEPAERLIDAVVFPETLRQLRLNLAQASHTLQTQLLSQLPTGLEQLCVEIRHVSDLSSLRHGFAPQTLLQSLHLCLRDGTDAAMLSALIATLPSGCERVVIDGIDDEAREVLRREVARCRRVPIVVI